MKKIIEFLDNLLCSKYKVDRQKLKDCQEDQDILQEINEALTNQMNYQKEYGSSGDWWNKKWPKAHISYPIQGAGWFDVRTVFGTSVPKENELRKVTKSWEKLTPDEIAKKALYYVTKRTVYKSDSEKQGKPEYWQNAYVTYESRSGDCEDGAILIFKLMQLAGVPAWRRKLCAGFVKSSPTAPEGGHAYAIYLADDGQWYVLDWCYFPSIAKSSLFKKPHRDLDYYKEIWWTTNEQFSWNQKDFKIKGGLRP